MKYEEKIIVAPKRVIFADGFVQNRGCYWGENIFFTSEGLWKNLHSFGIVLLKDTFIWKC